MAKGIAKIDGMEFRFERRRYPGCTYTWASVRNQEGNWISLGDPWPCITPKHSELTASARKVLAAASTPPLVADETHIRGGNSPNQE